MCVYSNPTVYVSGHDKAQAKALADRLRAEDYEVSSTWHDQEGPKVDTSDRMEWSKRWDRNSKAIRESNAFVMFASDERVPSGKFVELGYALRDLDDKNGDGKYIVVIGNKPENGMAANDDITYVPDETTFINSL